MHNPDGRQRGGAGPALERLAPGQGARRRQDTPKNRGPATCHPRSPLRE